MFQDKSGCLRDTLSPGKLRTEELNRDDVEWSHLDAPGTWQSRRDETHRDCDTYVSNIAALGQLVPLERLSPFWVQDLESGRNTIISKI